jgi:DNA-binding response OmpR family regulator
MDIALVHWPEHEEERRDLKLASRSRLLLVAECASAPISDDPLEDWIRLPAAEADLQARLDGLMLRSPSVAALVPELDESGRLRIGGRWVSLPPIEHRLAFALVDRIDAVVSREVLGRAVSSGGATSRNALDVHMLRLRRRIHPLGLSIRTVRSRGYVLEVASRAAEAGV